MVIEGKLLFWWAYYQLRGTRRKGKDFGSACRREGMNRNQGYYGINSAGLRIAEGLTRRQEEMPESVRGLLKRNDVEIGRILREVSVA
jgi:hypothetical protein